MYPKHLFNQTITLHSGGDKDDYGQTSGTTTATHDARVEFVNKTMGARGENTGTNEIIVVSAKIWLAPDVTVEEHAKIVHDGHTYRVEKVIKIPDAAGTIRFIELDCSEWAQ